MLSSILLQQRGFCTLHGLPFTSKISCRTTRHARTVANSEKHSRNKPRNTTPDTPAGIKALQRGYRLKPDLGGAYRLLADEARALGIPEHALPVLSEDPTFEEVQKAHAHLQAIMASFVSANI